MTLMQGYEMPDMCQRDLRPHLRPSVFCAHAQFGVFLFFASMMAIMTVWVWLLLPETKGVPVEEIMTVWARSVL